MAAVIFKRRSGGIDEYWTGEMDRDGKPITTASQGEAYHFKTHEIALTVADTHRSLKDSDVWRVVPRSQTGQ